MKYFHLKENVFLYIYISDTMTRLRIIDLNIKKRAQNLIPPQVKTASIIPNYIVIPGITPTRRF